ncbi:MAG: hypothetical protein M1836_000578 [Candelina mexicana]|nr:MAG: hypothetical protein M1836_000578 [Candelina mexicana]
MSAFITAPALLVSLLLSTTCTAAGTNDLVGRGSIDTFDYVDMYAANLVYVPVTTCGMAYNSLDLTRVVGVHNLTQQHCGQCLRVCGWQSRTHYDCNDLLAVDGNMQEGITISSGSSHSVLGNNTLQGQGFWFQVAQQHCAGIWNGRMASDDKQVVSLVHRRDGDTQGDLVEQPKVGTYGVTKHWTPVTVSSTRLGRSPQTFESLSQAAYSTHSTKTSSAAVKTPFTLPNPLSLPNGFPQTPEGPFTLPNPLSLLNGFPQTPEGLPNPLSLPNGFPQTPEGLPQVPYYGHRTRSQTNTIPDQIVKRISSTSPPPMSTSDAANERIKSWALAVDCVALGAVNCNLPVPGAEITHRPYHGNHQEPTSSPVATVTKVYYRKRGYPQTWMNSTGSLTTTVVLKELHQSTMTSIHTVAILAQTPSPQPTSVPTAGQEPGVFLSLEDDGEVSDEYSADNGGSATGVTVDSSSLSTFTSSPTVSPSAAESSPSPTGFSSLPAASSLSSNVSTTTIQLFPGHYFELSNRSNRWCAISVLTFVIPVVMVVMFIIVML